MYNEPFIVFHWRGRSTPILSFIYFDISVRAVAAAAAAAAAACRSTEVTRAQRGRERKAKNNSAVSYT